MVAQAGRLSYEAILFLASLRATNPNFPGRVFVAEPRPGPLWPNDPTIVSADVRQLIRQLGGTFVRFDSRIFGATYPHGNKIEALKVLPTDMPFVFFDTDTLITGDLMSVPFDFDKPSASLNVENTWPLVELYGPGYAATWKSLYDKFGLDFESSLDMSQPDEFWRRYLYFNAGYFYYRDAAAFGQRFAAYARAIRNDPPPELVCQSMNPWLDQVTLPLVVHALGGGRDRAVAARLDGDVSFHYRVFPLFYVRATKAQLALLEEITAPHKIKKVLKDYDPIKRMVYQGRGEKARALFDQRALPRKEKQIRELLKKKSLWLR
ncbi:MAG: hypothetical protein AAF330_02220 [Pseudomonadota bacterium]